MTVALLPFDAGLAAHVARNMREVDRCEVFATRYDDDPDAIVADLAQVPGFSWVAARDGEPCAVVGARPLWPGMWGVYAFGTDRWREVIVSLTRHARRFMVPAIEAAGARRAICYSHAEHREAHAWLRALGATEEIPHPAWGRNGEDFILFSWRR